MRLFKYLDEKAIDLFLNRRFKVSQACTLNDPFEFVSKPNRILTRETILKELRIKSVQDKMHDALVDVGKYRGARHNFYKWVMRDVDIHVKDLQESYRDGIVEGIKNLYDWQSKIFGVICLSKRPNSLLMWSHYTNGHKGFVVEMNLDEYPFTEPGVPYQMAMVKVAYSNELVEIPASIHKDNYEQTIAITKLISTKYLDWKYENEYRFLHLIKQVDNVEEIGEPPFYVTISPRLIKQVVFGCRIEAPVRKQLLSVLSENEWQHVVVKEACMHEDRYKLNYKLVPK